MKFVDLLAEHPYILKEERDLIEAEELLEDDATKFILNGLDYTAQKQIEADLSGGKARMPMNSVGKGKKDIPDSAMMEVDLNARGMEIELKALRAGFVRIDGPNQPEEEYPSDMGKRNHWFIQYLPKRVRTEIANHLIEQGQLSEEEVKN